MDISELVQGVKESKEEDQCFIPFQQWVALKWNEHVNYYLLVVVCDFVCVRVFV